MGRIAILDCFEYEYEHEHEYEYEHEYEHGTHPNTRKKDSLVSRICGSVLAWVSSGNQGNRWGTLVDLLGFIALRQDANCRYRAKEPHFVEPSAAGVLAVEDGDARYAYEKKHEQSIGGPRWV